MLFYFFFFFFYYYVYFFFFFFFSSRRRHTRCLSDWSSDVCSSDLTPAGSLVAYSHFANVPGSTPIRLADSFCASATVGLCSAPRACCSPVLEEDRKSVV